MGYRLAVLLLVLAANAFFAGAEVALVSARQASLRALAERGVTGAQAALSLLANPGRLLSVTQVGVTVASLGLGWAGEDTIYRLLFDWLLPLQHRVPGVLLHGVAFAVAFLAIAYAHVIIGEVVPKNLALEKAARIAVMTAPPLLVFYRLVAPFVVVLERSTALLLRVFGLSAAGEGRGGHSAEELKYIIQSSGKEGHLEPFQQEVIQRILDLSNYSAREVMTPRHNIISLPVDSELDQVLNVMAEHKYARVPVYEDRPEHIIGIVHYKDLMRVWEERRFAHERKRTTRPFRLRRFVRKALVVPETKPLDQLIDEFRTTHNHMALVVDEFGTISGVVTLEDTLEQIFGDIGDEHDLKRPPVHQESAKLEVEGSTTIRDLETRYHIVLPADAGFETLAGFLLMQFGYIPRTGQSIEHAGRRFTITEMEKNRIAKVQIERLEPKQAVEEAAL